MFLLPCPCLRVYTCYSYSEGRTQTMKKNTCQFCGCEKTKLIENWLDHSYLGLICNECLKGKHVKMLLNKYPNKRKV